jgi:hypothetical protein
VVSFHLHRLRRYRTLALILTLLAAAMALFATPEYGCATAAASDTAPADYCYQTDIAITYSGAGTATDTPVRVAINALGMTGSGQMDPRAWDIKPILGNFSNEVFLSAQDMTDSEAPFWITVPSISTGETRTHRLYTGSGEQRRDQGINFTGQEYLKATNHANFSVSNNFQLDVTLWNYSDTARVGFIADRRLSNSGYTVSFRDVASALTLRFSIDAADCDLTWDSGWTGSRQDFRFEYISAVGNDAFIYRNGTLAKSCDLDQGTIGAAAQDFTIGAENPCFCLKLEDVALYNVVLRNTGVVVASYGFDADSMSETVATNPYQGTVADYSGNAHTATYVFDRDQSDWSYSVGPTQLVSGANQITLPDTNPDVLGPAFSIDPGGVVAENTSGIIYNVFLDKYASSAPIRSFGYIVALGLAGVLLAILVYKLTRYIPITLFAFGIPFAVGVSQGWIAGWWMILWAVMALGAWFAHRLTET